MLFLPTCYVTTYKIAVLQIGSGAAGCWITRNNATWPRNSASHLTEEQCQSKILCQRCYFDDVPTHSFRASSHLSTFLVHDWAMSTHQDPGTPMDCSVPPHKVDISLYIKMPPDQGHAQTNTSTSQVGIGGVGPCLRWPCIASLLHNYV